MRKLSLLLAFIPLFSTAQEFISPDTTFERQSLQWVYTGVILTDSTATKDQLYQKSRQWFSEAFESAKSVIDNADKEEGVIYGKATIMLKKDVDGVVSFNIEIRCKDGRVKYTMRNFAHKDGYMLNTYGYASKGGEMYSFGPLTPVEPPFGYGKTGRNSKKFWAEVKDISKATTYVMVLSLKKSLSSESLKKKDSW